MMLKLALAQAKALAGRYVASVLAVVAVGFVVSTLVLGSTMRASTMDSLAAQYTGVDAVVLSGGRDPDQVVERVRASPGVGAVSVDRSTFVTANTGDGPEFAELGTVASDEAADGLRWQRIVEGAGPNGLGQTLVSASSGIDLGATVKPAPRRWPMSSSAAQAC